MLESCSECSHLLPQSHLSMKTSALELSQDTLHKTQATLKETQDKVCELEEKLAEQKEQLHNGEMERRKLHNTIQELKVSLKHF